MTSSSAIIADSKIRQVRVADLRPHEKNARTITTEMFLKLRRSIAANPELLKARPVLALPDGRIIGGRFRWEAVKAEGWETVPTFAHDWDEDEALEIMLRDNNPYGEDDDDLVAEILWGLRERGRDLDLVGLPSGDVKKILASVGPDDDDREDELPRVPGRPKSKAGQVYELGRHRIMVGDSTNPDDVATLLDGASVDMVVTSPPYNVDVQYQDHVDKAEWPEYGAFLRAALDAWLPHVAPGRAVVWNVGPSPATFHARQLVLLEDVGLTYYRQYVWRKVGVAMPQWHHTLKAMRVRCLKSNYMHEVVAIFSNGPELELGPELDVVDDLLEHDFFMIHQATSTRDVPTGNTRAGTGKNMEKRAWKAHPAVFPVRLPQAFIAHLTGRDELVVDPFVGSGSTILAAEKVGRVCYGMEKSPAYVDVARERWERLHGGG